MGNISISTVAELECGGRIKAPLVSRFFNKLKKGEHERTSDLTLILRELENLGYTPHYKQDKKTEEYRLSHFTFKNPD